MPELPEVEIVRRGLLSKILGETIDNVEIFREQSIAYPEPKKFAQNLSGLTVIDIDRRGKYLILRLNSTKPIKISAKQNIKKPPMRSSSDDSFLVVHLRMSGRLLLMENEGKKVSLKFLRVKIFFNSGRILCFDDMRVFGRLWHVESGSLLAEAIPSLNNLGMEPLGILKNDQLARLFKGRRQAIKSVLLDQTVLAGIGNIYADEILFQAGIHPLMSAGKISNAKRITLAKIIPLTLNGAIELGGSSIKDFVDTNGVNGRYQHKSLVYGRAGKPCRTCENKIERIKIAGRSAHFCPNCQQLKSR